MFTKFTTTFLSCCVGAALLSGGQAAKAHSGDFDPHFGSAGTSTIAVPSGIAFSGYALPVAVDHSNRIVYGVPTPEGDLIGALDASGILDASFGFGGVQKLGYYVADLAIDSHDRILVLEGDASPLFFSSSVTVSRYFSDGSLDLTFGTMGTTTIADTGYDFTPSSIALDENDDAYLVGTAVRLPDVGETELWVARVENDGVIDTSFGGGGTGWTLPLPAADLSQGLAIVPDDKGDVFATGSAQTDPSLGLVTLVKLTPAGLLDTSFGAGAGFVTTDADPTTTSSHQAQGKSVVVDNLGNLVVAGSINVPFSSSSSVVLRYLPNGDIDPLFAAGAPLVLAFDGDDNGTAQTVMLDGRNRIVVTGITEKTGDPVNFFALRLNEDGTPDTSFGSGAGYRIVNDSAFGGRSAFVHGENILMLGNTDDSTSVVASELIGYDLPPITPPGHFPLIGKIGARLVPYRN
jgi:uncharacterized delta-60 repeat protein